MSFEMWAPRPTCDALGDAIGVGYGCDSGEQWTRC